MGGELADPGAWPDTAAVANAGVVNCTGVLIAPDVVLTAGHCAWGITHVVVDSTNHLANGETISVEHGFSRHEMTGIGCILV